MRKIRKNYRVFLCGQSRSRRWLIYFRFYAIKYWFVRYPDADRKKLEELNNDFGTA